MGHRLLLTATIHMMPRHLPRSRPTPAGPLPAKTLPGRAHALLTQSPHPSLVEGDASKAGSLRDTFARLASYRLSTVTSALLLSLGNQPEAHAVPASNRQQQPFVSAAQRSGVSASTPPHAPQELMTFGVWVDALTDLLDDVPAPAIDAEYAAFTKLHGLPAEEPRLRRDFRRMRLLFEATRDGGFWHLRWDITDKYPSSRLIWQQWIREPVRRAFGDASATAECDELSALVGMLARHLELYNVGLFYPTWNHTIAVWSPLEGKTRSGLVQLPTTQIFQACDAGFDHTTFVTRLKGIERYPNLDLGNQATLPRERAEWLLDQIRLHAAASPLLWSLIRAKRAHLMGSSMGACGDTRKQWQQQIASRFTEGDLQTLAELGTRELGYEHRDAHRVLAWLSE